MADFSPTFIKRDPVTGLTFYDFDGHVKAQGIDLDALSGAALDPPPADRRIAWHRTADGGAVALIWGSSDNVGPTPGLGTGAQIDVEAVALGALGQDGDQASVNINARVPIPGNPETVNTANLLLRRYRAGGAYIDELWVMDNLLHGSVGRRWLRMTDATKGNAEIQTGSTVLTPGGGGEVDFNIPLTQAWPTEHLGFTAHIWPRAPFVWGNVTPRGAKPADRFNGSLHLALGSGGTIDVYWISIGR